MLTLDATSYLIPFSHANGMNSVLLAWPFDPDEQLGKRQFEVGQDFTHGKLARGGRGTLDKPNSTDQDHSCRLAAEGFRQA
jgi:hypothetical protein